MSNFLAISLQILFPCFFLEKAKISFCKEISLASGSTDGFGLDFRMGMSNL